MGAREFCHLFCGWKAPAGSLCCTATPLCSEITEQVVSPRRGSVTKWCLEISILRPEHNGWWFACDIFKCIFLTKIGISWFQFSWNLSQWIQLTTSQHYKVLHTWKLRIVMMLTLASLVGAEVVIMTTSPLPPVTIKLASWQFSVFSAEYSVGHNSPCPR